MKCQGKQTYPYGSVIKQSKRRVITRATTEIAIAAIYAYQNLFEMKSKFHKRHMHRMLVNLVIQNIASIFKFQLINK